MWRFNFDKKNKVFDPSIPLLKFFDMYDYNVNEIIISGKIKIFSKIYSIKYKLNNNIIVHEIDTDLTATCENKILFFTINDIILRNYQILDKKSRLNKELNRNFYCTNKEIDIFHEDIFAKIIFYINNRQKCYFDNSLYPKIVKYEFVTEFGFIELKESIEKKYLKIENKKIMFSEMDYLLNKIHPIFYNIN
ncbi:MAG: hypothetical protein CMF62_01010 [Magnetococcales bacterium]|nr:hypothetical protein [Magnetococcales bacterium]|tara:strand:+ start:36631 stop:37206 length:576 start_codon:yes stop_codon:yes gene_type:complete